MIQQNKRLIDKELHH